MSKIALSGNASGTGTFTIASPNSNTDRTLTLPDAGGTAVLDTATQTLTNKTIQGGAITSGTAVASTSGTSIDFTGIPSWVRRITVMLVDVSLSGTNNVAFQLGTSGGVVTSGYNAGAISVSTLTSSTTNGGGLATAFFFTTGAMTAASLTSGSVVFVNVSGNTWVQTGTAYSSGAGRVHNSAGSVALGGTLDRVRITAINGTDTFDAGSINILYEG
jgi:hypothetical protein